MRRRPGRSIRRPALCGFAAASVLVIGGLGPTRVEAAPPPQALVLTSGRSVLDGSLSGLIVLPDGWLEGGALTARLLPAALRETDVLIWDVATDTVTAVPGFEPMILPYGWAGAYHSTEGRLELARIAPPSTGRLVNHVIALPSGTKQLGAWLQEAGTVAVLTPVLGVPEPTPGLAWPVLVLAALGLAARRPPREATKGR